MLISHSTIRIGQSTLSITNLRTVFAEGRLDGHYTQVFGSMAADPIRLKGIPVDVAPGTRAKRTFSRSATGWASSSPCAPRFSMRDNEFTVPHGYGCGPLTHSWSTGSACRRPTTT